MMRTSYDPEVDALFVWFAPEGVKLVGTQEVAPGIMLDFDQSGTVIGVEVLDVRKRVAGRRPAEPGARAEEEGRAVRGDWDDRRE